MTGDAFVGQRHPIRRYLVCAMQGHFPVLARGADDALAIVFRTGAPHYGLPGTLATAWSADGRAWSDPIEVAPRWDDIRNPAFGVDARGRWILAYWQASVHAYAATPDGERRWRLPAPDALRDAPDLFVVTSDDRGRTWSRPAPYASPRLGFVSPYGRITLAPDGALVLAAYGSPRDGAAGHFDAVILRSRDGGATWDERPVAAGASELAVCWLDARRVAGAVRLASGATALVRSDDGGDTWSAPVAITEPGLHPGDLCRLASGRLLFTFGRRRRPLGCGALVSDDDGATWRRDREAILAGDGVGNDVGYPSTVQRDDGTIVTALYFARGSAASSPPRVGARCRARRCTTARSCSRSGAAGFRAVLRT